MRINALLLKLIPFLCRLREILLKDANDVQSKSLALENYSAVAPLSVLLCTIQHYLDDNYFNELVIEYYRE